MQHHFAASQQYGTSACYSLACEIRPPCNAAAILRYEPGNTIAPAGHSTIMKHHFAAQPCIRRSHPTPRAQPHVIAQVLPEYAASHLCIAVWAVHASGSSSVHTTIDTPTHSRTRHTAGRTGPDRPALVNKIVQAGETNKVALLQLLAGQVQKRRRCMGRDVRCG